jgi:DNA-binding CsgD family transcriptional regulator
MAVVEPLERSAELEQLAELLDSAERGHGRACAIEGSSGVGKTCLLDYCADAAETLGMFTLRARGSELTQGHPFAVVRALFEGTLIRADYDTRGRLMRGPAVLAEPVFGLGVASDEFSVIHGLYWLTVNLAENRPVAILVDDIHWFDDSSLRFLAYLAERIDDLAVALVFAIRSGDPGAESQLVNELWDTTSGPPIRPSELSDGAVRKLLAGLLPGPNVDASVVRSVVHETGGNPFLVLAVADAMSRGEDAEVATPEAVRRQIAGRLGRLTPAARTLAEAASVLGDDAAMRDVIHLAGLRPDHGVAAAEELVARHLFATSDPIMFVHRVIRMAVYSTLEPSARLTLHERSAKLLAANRAQPEVVAEHLLRSGPADPPWAVAALHEAGRAAARKGAPNAAARYMRHAVEVADFEQLPPALLIDLGLAEAAAGEPISLDRFEQALDLVSEPEERADALYSLGQTLYRFGRYGEAGLAFRRGAHLFESGEQQVRMRFEGSAWSAESHYTPARHGPVSIAKGDGPGDRAIMAVQALQESLTTPPAARAAELANRALGDGALLAEQTSQGPSVNLATLALLHCGRVIDAQTAADATVRDARERGARHAHAEALLVRSLIGYARGHIIDAAADAEAAMDGMRLMSHAHAQTAVATLVHCMIDRGELDEAAKLIEHPDTRVSLPEGFGIQAYVRVARGRVHYLQKDIGAARDDLDAAEDALHDFSATNPAMLPWRSLAGLIAHAAGDEAKAHRLIHEEVRLARLFDVPIALGIALRRQALTEAKEQAPRTFREAVRVLETTEAKLEFARAHAGLGRALRRVGERVDARTHLGIALDLAHRCGATALEAEIRADLTAAGARTRRPAVTGVESLTPTELRVAQLAAQGLSNREIAEQMFVSRSTVAWHVRNVYRKLQVDSRDQLKVPIDD